MLYAKLAGILLAMAAVAWLGRAIYSAGEQHTQIAWDAAKQADALALAKDYQQREADHIAKETALGTENAQLKNDALKYPTVAVRMCKYPVSPIVPAAGEKGPVISSGAGVGTPDPKPVPSGAGPDYGKALFGLADLLDSVAARCRAL